MRIVQALLMDAYRQLNAKKLFWITLGISLIVVVFYASIGFNDAGMSLFFGLKQVDSEIIREGSPMARMLYRGIFSTFILSFWLAWAASILALISTTTIFPDFLAGGSIELALSKPTSRPVLFLLKYLTSLLFVVLQVAIFCVGIFLCMGWRLGDWNWLIFAAIPLVTLFYSYLYSINVLVGVVTRSGLTALLVTLLAWFMMFSIAGTEVMVRSIRTQATIRNEATQERIQDLQQRLDAQPAADVVQRLEAQQQMAQAEYDRREETLSSLRPWHDRTLAIRSVLPKTGETIELLDRWLAEESDVNLMDLIRGNVSLDASGKPIPTKNNFDRRVEVRMLEEYGSRSLWYIIGTSLLFEIVLLSIACFVFVRRDF